MITIVSLTRRVVNQALHWTALSGAAIIMGQAPVLAGDSVSVLMKQSLADMAGKVATVLTVDYAPGAASDPHVVSKNASVTESAKLLVLLLSQEGEALKLPVKIPDSGK